MATQSQTQRAKAKTAAKATKTVSVKKSAPLKASGAAMKPAPPKKASAKNKTPQKKIAPVTLKKVAKKLPVKNLTSSKVLAVSPEEHYRMVAEAAYFIAEKRGFTAGDHAADWAEAEQQIIAALRKG